MAPVRRQAGYSGTPLVAKLGIKPGARMQVVNQPADFRETLGRLPDGVMQVSRGTLDFGILFVLKATDLEKRFPVLRDRITVSGMLWIAWPKKTSGVASDLTEDIVRAIALEAGLVDVKVCAVDATWSALKFVRRLRDR